MKRKRFKKVFLLFILLFIILFYIFLKILRPIALQYSQNVIQQTASYAIHDALTDIIYENRSDYQQLVTLERDSLNQVTALKTDTILADFLKIQISRTTYDALNTLEQSGVDIPLGSIFAPTLFAGHGPSIHVGIASLGFADADFISAFTSAGINQTRHQILLEVNAEAQLITCFGMSDVKITNELVVTDTVIVGNVPESYTYIDDTEQSLLGKINDYAN